MRAFVIARDRMAYAQRCLAALLAAGLEPVIIDQGSSWPPMLAWLDELERDRILVLRRGGGHPRGIWGWQPFRDACGAGRYLVTDCDVLPADDCPADWPARLGAVLDAHPEAVKAGLGLRIDNVPPHYARRDQVLAWEAKFWQYPVDGGSAYRAGIDTALALYRPLAEQPMFGIDAALRTGPPYTADHLPWFEDLDHLDPDVRYYYEHAERGIAHWAPSGLSAWGD